MYMISESLAVIGVVMVFAAGLFVAAALVVLTQACVRAIVRRARQAASQAGTALAELETRAIVTSERP